MFLCTCFFRFNLSLSLRITFLFFVIAHYPLRFLLRVSRTKNSKVTKLFKNLSAFVLDSRPVLSMVCYIFWSIVVRVHAISLHFPHVWSCWKAIQMLFF